MDTRLYLDVNSFEQHTTWLHGFFTFYANAAGAVLLVLLLAVGWLLGRRQADATDRFALVLLAGVGAVVAEGLNKEVFTALSERPRPCIAHPAARHLLDCTASSSFPSDHAMIAGSLAAGLWLVNRYVAMIATVAAVLLAFGRIYVGVHYPSDVLAGLVIGAIITVGIQQLARRPVERLAAGMCDGALRPIVRSKVPRHASSSRARQDVR